MTRLLSNLVLVFPVAIAIATGITLMPVQAEALESQASFENIKLQVLLQTHPAQWMIWEANPNPETVTQLKTMGISSLVFAPVANQPDTGDFLSIMQQNIENLQLAFSP